MKTTMSGILTIVGGVVAFILVGLKTGNFTDITAITVLLAAISTGIGLIKAADASK